MCGSFFFLDSSWNYRGQWVILHHRGGDRFNVLRLKRSFYPLFFFSIVLVLVLNGQSCDQVLLGLAYFSHWRSSAVKHFTLGEQASISKKKYCILVCNRDRIKFWNYFFFFVTFIDNEIRYCFFFYFFFLIKQIRFMKIMDRHWLVCYVFIIYLSFKWHKISI